MKLSDFDYSLPSELIAQHPVEPRDHSRLMVIDSKSGNIAHHMFYQVADYFNPGDTLVFNDSRVIPARLKGIIASSERHAELLLLKQLTDNTWEALVRPGRRLLIGSKILISGLKDGLEIKITATITDRREDGIRVVEFSEPAMVEKIGEIPLPPYIKSRLDDKERYQTVYSSVKGSAAAPTAGLHFTPELLKTIKNKGVNLTFVTLHIGLDTFQPVRAEDPNHHQIHTEFGMVSQQTADLLNDTKRMGKRVIAVGTTTVRLIEAASLSGQVQPIAAQVGIFILPGFRFKVTDALLTNFHLPKSTLLMMVSAFAGRELILDCYEKAKGMGYHFYSFGDAMLIQ